MRIAICDDDREYTEKLKNEILSIINISEYGNDFFDFAIFTEPKDLIEFAKKQGIDILFLDVDMPGMNGIEVAKCFNDYHSDTLIIFISNFDEYVYYSIKLNPFRYIRKKMLDVELEEAISSAISFILQSNAVITLTNHNDCVSIKVSRIIYAQKEKGSNYINIYCVSNNYRYRCGINELISKLNSNDFVRISLSTIVNMKYIQEISDGMVCLGSDIKLRVASSYLSSTKKQFIKFIR